MSKNGKDNSDFMSRKQDDELEQLEERLTALYANAENELRAKYTDFAAGFEKNDKRKRDELDSGLISEDEYTAWRKTQILKSTQYTKAVESMTNVLVNTDVAAMALVEGQLPRTIAESYDYVQALGCEAAKGSGLKTATFQIYNAESVQALIRDNPDLLPKPQVDIPIDEKWNKDRINREITQGILQGESIPDIATRLQAVTTMDRNAAVRNARTAMTGAENLGRYESAQNLREQGIPVGEVWSAAKDNRTRETHRLLDGTTRDDSGYFGVGIIATPLRFAGDPNGDPEEVYNCRCRTGIVLQGIDHSQDDKLYEEFMKQFEDGQDVLDGKEPDPEAESQHQEPEQKTIDEIQPEIATSESESLPEPEDLSEKEETPEEKEPTVETFETKTFDNAREATEYFRGSTYDSNFGTMGKQQGFGVREDDNKPATKWQNKLTYDQTVAVTDYTGNSYEPVNNFLRGIWDKKEAADMMTGNYTVNKEIKLLDGAIKKYDLKEPITVHRTCEREFVDQLEIGGTFHDDGYGSTSVLDTPVASGDVHFEIDVPAGKGVGAYVDGLSWKEGEEFEFLLARGADYYITEKEIRKDGIYIKAVVTGFTPKQI